MGRFFTKSVETARAGCSAGRAGRIHPHGESVKKACHCEETQRLRSTRKGYAASVRRQSRQRLRSSVGVGESVLQNVSRI